MDNDSCASTKRLYEIVGEIDDVTEPSYMEKIYSHLETLYKEDEEFIHLLENKLKNCEITWTQPWYQISNSLTRPLKNDDNEPFDTDYFTQDEIKHIDKKWKKFIKQYALPDKPMCLARWRNKDKCRNPYTPVERARKFVMAYLAKGLKRNLYQVYKNFVTLYAYPVRGSYSTYEKKVMELCTYHSPRNASIIISLVLGREPRAIYKIMQQVDQGKPESKRLKWDINLASKFINSLMKHSGLPLDKLKCKQIDSSIWLKMEEEFDQQYIYLRRFWWDKLHVQLFVHQDVKIKKLRKKIFKKLRVSKYSNWSDIRWKKFTQQFPDGFTHFFLYKVAVGAFGGDKKYLKIPLDEAIEYAFKRIKSRGNNKRLKNLKLNDDGMLEIVHYDKTINT